MKPVKKDNNKLIPIIYFAGAYPLYVAFDVVITGNLGNHCTRSSYPNHPVGIFCKWGTDLGTSFLGANYAHIGFAAIMFISSLAWLGFVYWVTRPTHQSSGTR